MFETCCKLTIKTLERFWSLYFEPWRDFTHHCPDVLLFDFEQVPTGIKIIVWWKLLKDCKVCLVGRELYLSRYIIADLGSPKEFFKINFLFLENNLWQGTFLVSLLIAKGTEKEMAKDILWQLFKNLTTTAFKTYHIRSFNGTEVAIRGVL